MIFTTTTRRKRDTRNQIEAETGEMTGVVAILETETGEIEETEVTVMTGEVAAAATTEALDSLRMLQKRSF